MHQLERKVVRLSALGWREGPALARNIALEGPAESGVESRAGLATESGVEWT